MRRRVVAQLLVAALIVVMPVTGYLLVGSGKQGAWSPTKAQVAVANKAGLLEAESSFPGIDGAPEPQSSVAPDSSGWPTNVQRVTVSESTRGAAAPYTGVERNSDPEKVLIIQLYGQFSVAASGPPGSPTYESGQFMTVIVDAESGEVLDFQLVPTGGAQVVPDSADLFIRAS